MNPVTRMSFEGAWRALFTRYGLIGLALILTVSRPLLGQKSGGESLPYPIVEPHKAEVCIVCDKAIGQADRVYEVEGQRAPVHLGACDQEFRQAPQHYLARLKPRGAFLGAEPNLGPNITWGWFVFGIYVLLGLLFGALSAYRAVNHALNPFSWFLAGFFLNIFGFMALLTRSAGDSSAVAAALAPGLVKVPTTSSPHACPRCGNMNHPSANSCSWCGNKLEPLVPSEVARAGLRGDAPNQAAER